MSFDHSQEHPPHTFRFYQHGDATFQSFQPPDSRDPGDLGWENVMDLIYWVEAAIHQWARTKPPDLRHLDDLITDASQRTRGVPLIGLEDFRRLHAAFLTASGLYIDQADLGDELRQKASDMTALSRIVAECKETRAVSMCSTWRPIRARLVENGDPGLV